MKERTTTIGGWGKYPQITGTEWRPSRMEECPTNGSQSYLPRGLGRSYGDASIPGASHTSLNTCGLKHLLHFDPATGIVTAEAGISLEELLDIFVPKGYFLPVTPGTKMVTLGGAVASNVHGKNHHHVGSIGNFITSLRVRTPIGTFDCSPTERADLFRGTISGYGLTGLIEHVSLRLRRIETAYMMARKVQAPSLEAAFDLFDAHDQTHEFNAAWIDTLSRGKRMGRSVLFLGDHATLDQLDARRAKAPLIVTPKTTISVPFDAPPSLLNPLTLRMFNQAVYTGSYKDRHDRLEDYNTFFYPLDFLHDWNRMYGKGGFLQYQFSIPDPHSKEGIQDCIKYLSDNGIGSFLSVLKRYDDDHGIVPFAQKGYALAMDIPLRRNTLAHLDHLDAMVIDYGGHVYLSKDARLSAATFRAMYPKAHIAWREVIAKYNPDRTVWSAMAERLAL